MVRAMAHGPGERHTSRTSFGRRLVAPAATALLALLGGCSLVLDFDPLPDAAPIDAPVTEAQCMANEPNNEVATAVAIQPGELMAAICGDGESDYFKITIAANQTLSVKIAFMNRGGAGDLDLRLLSGDGGMAFDDSKTTADVEEVNCPGGTRCPASSLPAGTYVVQVVGARPTAEAPYTLTYTLTGP